jgi:branched-chain amino acid transport system permease protein
MLLLQLFVNGLATGCAIALVAISFSLVYGTARIFHVAHAGILTLGPYATWWLIGRGLPWWLAIGFAVLICAGAGVVIQNQLYARLEARKASPLVVLIASLGLLVMIQSTIAAVFSPNILRLPADWSAAGIQLGAVRLSAAQLATILSSLAILAAILLGFRRSVLGKRIRAVAANPELAEITRLQPQAVYRIVFAIASAIVCIPGVLMAYDYGLQPYTGTLILLTATIAMISGGIGSLAGAFAMSLVIAVLQNLALLVMPGQWSVATTFLVFVAFMILRPEGLVTGRQRRRPAAGGAK